MIRFSDKGPQKSRPAHALASSAYLPGQLQLLRADTSASGSEAESPGDKLTETVNTLCTGYPLEDVAAQLRLLPDRGFPIEIRPWRDQGKIVEAPLTQAEERRAWQRFEQILSLERKSESIFASACECYRLNPSPPRLLRLATYLVRWHGPAAAAELLKTEISIHPDWHGLNFIAGLQLLSQLSAAWPAEGFSAESFAPIELLLESRLDLAWHWPEDPVPLGVIESCHAALAVYFALRFEPEQACWHLNYLATVSPGCDLQTYAAEIIAEMLLVNRSLDSRLLDFTAPLLTQRALRNRKEQK